METKLIIALIRAKMINAKRECEALKSDVERTAHWHEWRGQEIMAQQLLDILEK